MGSDFLEEMKKMAEEIIKKCDICKGEGTLFINGQKVNCICKQKADRYVDYKFAGIDEEFWEIGEKGWEWEGDVGALKATRQFVDNIEKNKREGMGLIFAGLNGRGKTSLSVLILKEAIRKGYSAYCITVAELLEVIKGTADRNYERAEENKIKYDDIKDKDFLVLDNMDSEYVAKNGPDFNIAKFDMLCRYRSRNHMPTIITTNYSKGEFLENYRTSINSLLSGKNLFVIVPGEDYRPKLLKRKKEKK